MAPVDLPSAGAARQPARSVADARALPVVGLALAVELGIAALYFVIAGTTALPWAWGTFAAFATAEALLVGTVFRRDRALLEERLRPGPGVPDWDRAVAAAASATVVAGLVISALDVGRLHVADGVPGPLRAAGLATMSAGIALMAWAMAVNTFFSRVVRIQRERAHRVVSEGPYRHVRHPGYVGWIFLWTGASMALGSWLGVAIAVGTDGLIVLRTALEDRFLERHLEGYRDYAARVPCRLLPGVW